MVFGIVALGDGDGSSLHSTCLCNWIEVENICSPHVSDPSLAMKSQVTPVSLLTDLHCILMDARFLQHGDCRDRAIH
jgi:hypothetical protein